MISTLLYFHDFVRFVDFAQHEIDPTAAKLGLIASCVRQDSLGIGRFDVFVRLHDNSMPNLRSIVFFDRFGRCAGHVLYAYVDTFSGSAFLRAGVTPHTLAATRPGSNLWLFDFSAIHGQLRSVLVALRDLHFVDASAVTYFRNKLGRRIAKRLSREDCTSFFAQGSLMLPEQHGNAHSHHAVFLRKEHDGLLHQALAQLRVATAVGHAARLASRTRAYAALSLVQAMQRIGIPVSLGQHRLYRGHRGKLAGWISWAWLDNHGLECDARPLHEWAQPEWNCGDQLCLCDVFVSPDVVDDMAADLAGAWFPDEPLWLLTQPNQAPSMNVIESFAFTLVPRRDIAHWRSWLARLLQETRPQSAFEQLAVDGPDCGANITHAAAGHAASPSE